MRLTVLGCYGPYPSKEGACSGYLLQQGDTRLLMDVGPGVLGRLLAQVDIGRVDAVWLSHLHYDHTSDLLALRYLLEERALTLPVYTHVAPTPWCRVLLDHPLLRVTNVNEGDQVQVGRMQLSFTRMDHTAEDYAVQVNGTFLYTGDTRMCPALTQVLRSGVRVALADCAKPIGFQGPHMAADVAIALQRDTGVRLLATHYTPGTLDAIRACFRNIPAITCVQPGETYELDLEE